MRPAIAAPAEYISLLRRTWTEPAPFDHEGEFYRTRGTYSEIRCRQQPHIPIYGGGGSDAAIRALAPHVDVYMLWGEPLKDTAAVHGSRAARGGALRPQPDLQPIDPPDPGGNRGRAWDRARAILDRVLANRGGGSGATAPECRLQTAAAGRRRGRGARHLLVDSRSPSRPARRGTRLRSSARPRRSRRRCSNTTSSAPPAC